MIELVFGPGGVARAVYSDAAAPLCRALGSVTVRRASHVEPDTDGTWYADLGPVGGPVLRGHTTRQAALDAEVAWLRAHHLEAL